MSDSAIFNIASRKLGTVPANDSCQQVLLKQLSASNISGLLPVVSALIRGSVTVGAVASAVNGIA